MNPKFITDRLAIIQNHLGNIAKHITESEAKASAKQAKTAPVAAAPAKRGPKPAAAPVVAAPAKRGPKPAAAPVVAAPAKRGPKPASAAPAKVLVSKPAARAPRGTGGFPPI